MRECPECGGPMRKISVGYVEHSADGAQMLRQTLYECSNEREHFDDPLNRIRDCKPTTLMVSELVRVAAPSVQGDAP